MDYTKVPRALIYRERYSLEEFGVYEENNITRPFLDELLIFGSDRYPNIEDNALWCMNNAFYICTMILLEKDPRPRIYQYKKIATPEDIEDRFISDKYWSAIISMVFLLLQRLDTPLTQYQDEARQRLLTLIAKDVNRVCPAMFNSFSKRIKDDTAIPKEIPCNMFAPRVIDKEAVHDVKSDDDFDWEEFTNDMRERKIREIVKTFGTTEEEKHNVVKILRQALHDTYRETEKEDKMLDEIDKEIKLHFSPGGNRVLKETTKQEKQVDITPYENRIKELEEENREQGKQIKEFEELAKSTSKKISWHDKVRLELALLFMEKADCDMKKYGNKARAARVLQAITKLPISTCKNYVTNRDLNTQEHKEEILEINTELQALGTELRL